VNEGRRIDVRSEPQRVVAMMRTWAWPRGGRRCGRCSMRRSCLPWRTAAVERGMAAGIEDELVVVVVEGR